MIAKIAWKNVWRNKSRSLVVVFAITLGTIAGVFVAGLMKGWVDQRINSVIHTENGHLKIQNPNYLIHEEIQYSLRDIDSIIDYFEANKELYYYAPRSKMFSMATTAGGNVGLVLKGIDPIKEKSVSDIHLKILPNGGDYFETPSKLPQIVISSKTAEQLRIKCFKITNPVLDSLLNQGISIETVDKLQPLLDTRFDTEKKFTKAVIEAWTPEEIKKHAPKLMVSASYIKTRAKITFNFTKQDGQIGYQTFQVCGVYKTNNTMFDQMNAFVRQEDLAQSTGIGMKQYHEISLLIRENDSQLNQQKKQLEERFIQASVMTWKELAPDAGMMADFMGVYYYMIMGIIFFALAFGIINTMLMSILERIKELGMLMAIGMKKKKVFQMIMFETIFLTLTGSILGMGIGAILIAVTGYTGINFSTVAEGFEAIGWAAVVYPSIETSFFIGVTILVIIIGILSSVIPAKKALKLKPIEALRIE